VARKKTTAIAGSAAMAPRQVTPAVLHATLEHFQYLRSFFLTTRTRSHSSAVNGVDLAKFNHCLGRVFVKYVQGALTLPNRVLFVGVEKEHLSTKMQNAQIVRLAKRATSLTL
tara:strand:+ start:449 stop:787 length:339 start_codon:yes stop_codon:yes gene_type:complete